MQIKKHLEDDSFGWKDKYNYNFPRINESFTYKLKFSVDKASLPEINSETKFNKHVLWYYYQKYISSPIH